MRIFLEPFVFVIRVGVNAKRARISASRNGISMDMTGYFWLATMLMAVVAFGFVALPLLKNNRRNVLIAVAIALPLFAAGLYMKLGSPSSSVVNETTQQAASVATNQSDASTGDKTGSVASMVDGLAQRLEQNPDDGGSWLLLARSYKYLNRVDDAIDAYEKAAALGQFDTDLAALSSAENVAAAPGAQIFGNVSLSPAAMEIVKPDDVVIIFAKAVDGPPMPVAVVRRPVSDLPIDFLLNDSQSMTAGAELSNFERVTVTARITRKGDALTALQGLEANSEAIRVADNHHLSLIIE
jgi:tetratricopeptide (TPR) repeat protein